MNNEIQLILFKSSLVEWGWVLYPAKEEDRSIFHHCSGVSAEYMFQGGVVHEKYKELIWPTFDQHGYKPVVVGMAHANWELPLMEGEKGHLSDN